MVITDFDECIHYWLMYLGEKWKRCSECGKWIKQSNNNKNKYCKDCAKKIKLQKDLKRLKKSKIRI